MTIISRRSASDLRGALRLAVDATVGVTQLVEKMHHTIVLAHPPLGASTAGQTGGLTAFIYRSIRGTTRIVGKGIDAGMGPLVSLLPEKAPNSTRDALVAALNGVYGDHLLETGNPLATKMCFRYMGEDVDPGQLAALHSDKSKVMLFIHGLCLNDGHWTRNGVNPGEALARDLGYTPIYLRYNSGLSVAVNGLELTGMLEKLVKDLPGVLNKLIIVGHSMGGLVTRSACHFGNLAGHHWLHSLSKLVFIGTPHHGAPLERGGNWLSDVLNLSPYAAPFTRIARKRSAGISDLRHGSITDGETDCLALPAGVDCYVMAATLSRRSTRIHERLIGDGLVPIDSALGRSPGKSRGLEIPENRQWLGFETGHMELLAKPAVYEQLRKWLQ